MPDNLYEAYERRRLDRALIGGLVWGLLVGGLAALLRGPRLRLQRPAFDEVRDKLATVSPRDPVAESIAEGKAAARRLSELSANPRQ